MDVRAASGAPGFRRPHHRMTAPLKPGVLGERRAGLLADLTGTVLDVGAETGANLPYLRLRPGGQLIVLEHVRGSGSLARWQDHLTPLWSCLIPGMPPRPRHRRSR